MELGVQGQESSFPVMEKEFELFGDVFVSVSMHDCYSVHPGPKAEYLFTYSSFTTNPCQLLDPKMSY